MQLLVKTKDNKENCASENICCNAKEKTQGTEKAIKGESRATLEG